MPDPIRRAADWIGSHIVVLLVVVALLFNLASLSALVYAVSRSHAVVGREAVYELRVAHCVAAADAASAPRLRGSVVVQATLHRLLADAQSQGGNSAQVRADLAAYLRAYTAYTVAVTKHPLTQLPDCLAGRGTG